MSWPNDKFLFDFTVLLATLQSATSRGKSQLAQDKNHDNQFSLDSIGTKEGKENDKNKIFHNDQLIFTKRVDLPISQYRLLWSKKMPKNFQGNLPNF